MGRDIRSMQERTAVHFNGHEDLAAILVGDIDCAGLLRAGRVQDQNGGCEESRCT